jgi:hypothetical protein
MKETCLGKLEGSGRVVAALNRERVKLLPLAPLDFCEGIRCRTIGTGCDSA